MVPSAQDNQKSKGKNMHVSQVSDLISANPGDKPEAIHGAIYWIGKYSTGTFKSGRSAGKQWKLQNIVVQDIQDSGRRIMCKLRNRREVPASFKGQEIYFTQASSGDIQVKESDSPKAEPGENMVEINDKAEASKGGSQQIQPAGQQHAQQHAQQPHQQPAQQDSTQYAQRPQQQQQQEQPEQSADDESYRREQARRIAEEESQRKRSIPKRIQQMGSLMLHCQIEAHRVASMVEKTMHTTMDPERVGSVASSIYIQCTREGLHKITDVVTLEEIEE
jgi:hypothetical protein